ncbi:MAG: hypothetical protein U0791_18515 [Gemmataceae bacterium]
MRLHPELETILAIMLHYAQRLVSQQGATIPFGVLLGDGEPVFVAANFNRNSEEMMSLVRMGLFEGAAGKKAAGICYSADSLSDRPANCRVIRAELEHRDGTAFRIEVPWSRGWFGRIKWGERLVQLGTSQFLPAPA